MIYSTIKCRFRGPVVRQPEFPWQPFCVALVGGSSACQPPNVKLIGLPSIELLQFLTEYVTLRCDLDLWSIFTKMGQMTVLNIQGGPKRRIPSFIFGITSVIQHRLLPFFTVTSRNLWRVNMMFFHLPHLCVTTLPSKTNTTANIGVKC